jgi:gliding motility-associated-like protein/uncharacterized repeat protein (TIGR01451 family)
VSGSSDLSITKVPDESGYDAVGDVIHYTITVTNTGNVLLTTIAVTDPLTGLNETIPSLAPGASVSFRTTHTITQTDINAGEFNNTARARYIYAGENYQVEDDATVYASQGPELTLSKTAAESGYSRVGEIIHYTIIVTNTGNVTLTNINVTDPLTGYNQLISTLVPGASQTILTNYTIDQDDINAGSVLNRAIATYTYASREYSVDDDVTVYGSQGPDLTISKSASPTTYSSVDQSISYRVVVTNTGNVTLTSVVVSDPLTGLYQTIPILTPGESRIFNNTYDITQDDLNRGYVNNTATANYTFANTPYVENASARINANLSPAIDITKSVQESNYSTVGTTLHYTLVVRNTGNVTLTSVDVTDPLTQINQTIPSLDPGEYVAINATYIVNQGDINEGRVNNTARAVTVYNGTTYSDQASATVPASQNPRIAITKVATESNYTSVGDVIHYTLVVTNTGNVTLTGVTVTDPIADVSCPGSIGTLDPGEVVTCTATHTVAATDISDRSIHNTATATGLDPGGNSVSATASATVALRNLPPAIICPDPIITGTSETTCDVIINTGLNASFSDPNDNVASLTWIMTGATEASSAATGINQIGSHTFNLGVTTITYTVTDALGLSASCSFTVTVIDNVDPIARCRNIDVYLDINTGIVTIDEDDINNGSTDNCGIASISIDRTEFTCVNIGDNNVILTVIDNSGNSGTCTAVVTVHYANTTPPAVTPAADIICNDATTSLVLSSGIPSTTWTWTATPSSEITGASGDDSGLHSSISQTLHNSDIAVHNVIYTITPTVYGQCELDDITAEVWVNPTPLIQVTPAEQTICYGESSTITIVNPHSSVSGDWLYDLTVKADPGISGNTTNGTYTEPTNLTETLFNDDTVIRSVVYTFTPRITPPDGDSDCIGPEQAVTISVYPRVRYEKAISNYNGYNISCYGKANGYIRITPSENLGPYRYLWIGPGGFTQSTEDIDGLIAGQYTLSITDANNCTVTESFVLTQPDQISVTTVTSVCMDGAYNINCAGASTGSVAATAVNGVGKVEYMWIDGAVGSNRINLSAGNYKVKIRDSNNCLAEESVTLTEPEAIMLNFDIIDTYCPDSQEGAVSVNATGGVNGVDYTYIWSTNSNEKHIKDVKPGHYSVIVTDKNLCSVKDSARVKNLHEICLIIPDAFSPNGDLTNDTWVIGNIEFYPQAEITIYNRWGQMLWQSARGYPEAWDGRSKGINMPIDGYHYVIDLHNGYKLIVGDVTLVR